LIKYFYFNFVSWKKSLIQKKKERKEKKQANGNIKLKNNFENDTDGAIWSREDKESHYEPLIKRRLSAR
jgi:hypothetical protein